MPQGGKSFLRDNAFLVAAMALPGVVVLLFLLASAIPRWTVPPPQYDLVLRAGGPYDRTLPHLAIDFSVNDGRIEATIRALKADAFPQLASLFLFEHATLNVREIPVDLPKDLKEGDPPQTIVINLPGGGRVMPQAKAPDGYEMDTRTRRGGGIVGDIFGMNRYGEDNVLVSRGRLIPLNLPSPYRYQLPVTVLGWVSNDDAGK
jgi:hypothetical protein